MTYQPRRQTLPMALTVLTVLSALLGLTAATPSNAAPAQPAGAVGPIDPRTLQPDATHTRAVPLGGYTFYIDDRGLTATGAVVEDALLGFTPPANGFVDGPEHSITPCDQPPPQGVRDHATFTDAELDRYGLPPVSQVGTLAEWQTAVRLATGRACSYHDTYEKGIPLGSLPARHTTPAYQGSYDFHTGGPQYWNGWGDDGVDWGFNGTYVSEEGYVHVPAAGEGSFDVGIYDLSAWIGNGGLYGTPCAQQMELVQGGSQTHYDYQVGEWYHLFVENTGNPYNCYEQTVSLGGTVHKGDLVYMVQGCGYIGYTCTYMYVQDQTMTASPNYFGDSLQGWAPSGDSAECGVVELDSRWSQMPYFGTVTFEVCRTTVTEWGSNTEYGVGNVAYSHYDMFEAEENPLNCVAVQNFTDANNWTFSMYRNNAAPCRSF